MSHFTTIKTSLADRACLLRALQDLGLAAETGDLTIRGFAGQRTPVEIKVPSGHPGYDIGFRREGDAYQLVADWYGIPDIRPDEFLGRLTQRYACRVAIDQLTEQGFALAEEAVNAQGAIHLTLRRFA